MPRGGDSLTQDCGDSGSALPPPMKSKVEEDNSSVPMSQDSDQNNNIVHEGVEAKHVKSKCITKIIYYRSQWDPAGAVRSPARMGRVGVAHVRFSVGSQWTGPEQAVAVHPGRNFILTIVYSASSLIDPKLRLIVLKT
ncbi:hypothetical protein TSUD_101860 [Trifolium subterraneum]|uniref:Uncharacterized protein n=1 Tax=Trifolium subterraneum TaxID=3900 RepID=A0A2Z6MM94_TRISU|nr:hypothetical protein TSUD_101860 [Trifolium subterraneum]